MNTQTGAMYGKENTFFNNSQNEFENYVWIELIGFDNTKKDFGLEEMLSNMGFTPKGFLLLTTSVDIVNMHWGVTEEYTLDPYFCSYVAHEYNDERKRQEWTNFQLKGLVSALTSRGFDVYISFFDYLSPTNPFPHDELKTVTCIDGKENVQSCIYMTKRFKDGSFYEDFFLKKSIELLNDYGFSGMHLADGICRPRMPLQWADLSDDMLSQAGIEIPEEGAAREQYIAQNYRKKWIDFCTSRWMSCLEKIITGIKNAGFKTALNSTWTKNPMEAKYRYGIDYQRLDRLPVDIFVVENGAPTLSIIDNEANAGCVQSYEDRKFLHHAFRASLLLTGACMRNTPIKPLYPVRDTAEQYDVIHHIPTALPRHTNGVFATFVYKDDGTLKPVISGHTFCLGDGLSRDNWRYLRLCSDNAYNTGFKEIPGATVIWSDKRNENEIDALIAHRTPDSTYLLAKLLRNGAWVYKSAHIDNLDKVCGDILVTNPQLLPEDELKRVQNYKNGRVLFLSAIYNPEDFSRELNPVGVGFPYPLYFEEPTKEILDYLTKEINKNLPFAKTYIPETRIAEIPTDEKHSRFIVDNEEYYYTRPVIETSRKIKSASDITKVRGYRVSVNDTSFRTLVPLRGSSVVEVEFE